MLSFGTFTASDGRLVLVDCDNVIAVASQGGLTRILVGSDTQAQVVVSDEFEKVAADLSHCWVRGPGLAFAPEALVAVYADGSGTKVLLVGGVELSAPGVPPLTFIHGLREGFAHRQRDGFEKPGT